GVRRRPEGVGGRARLPRAALRPGRGDLAPGATRGGGPGGAGGGSPVGAGAVRLRPPPREIHLVIRITVCAAIAWQISLWAGASQPPVFAALVPLVAIKYD